MIADLKQYAEYKESGSRWLTTVPSHWEVHNLRTLIRRRNERNRADLPLLSVAREKGVFVRSLSDDNENHNVIPEDLSNYKVARAGNLVINKMKAWQGSMGIAPCDGIVSPAYFIFDFRIANHEFGQKLLRSKPYVAHFGQASDGVRVGQWDLTVAGMRQIPILVPPPDEQAAIVRFLDYVNHRIDRTIRAKKKVIALLNEQKQAIIHRAVTRGLNPNVPLRPSGIPWLGDIPSHWVLRPGMVGLREKQDKNLGFIEKRVLSLSYGRIIIKPEEKLRGLVPESFETYQIVNPGDIIIRPTDLQNDHTSLRVGLVKDRGIITSAYLCLKPLSILETEYAYQLLNTYDFMKIFYGLGSGTRQNLGFADFKRLPLLFPPQKEQTAITAFIEHETAQMLLTISRTEREISLLREYRTRLIADVVTGKVDVREAAKKLPDEVAESGIMDEDEISPEDEGEVGAAE